MKDLTMNVALNEAITEEMERDPNVFVLGEDIAKMGGSWGITKGLLAKYGPERVIDTPLCEAGPLAMAIGAALYGKRPIMEIMFADFLSVVYDGIVNQAAKMRYMAGGKVACPMVIRGAQGAGSGIGAHHSQSVEGWFMNVPGLKIVCPTTPYQAKGLMKAAIRDDNPVLFLEPKNLFRIPGKVPEGDYIVEIGKADVEKEGTDVTIIAYQLELIRAREAAAELEKQGISVEIVNPVTIKPFDKETIFASVRKTGRVLIAHEGCKTGGFGAELSAAITESCFEYLKAPIKRLGAFDSPIPYGKAEFFMIPTVADIINTAKSLVDKN